VCTVAFIHRWCKCNVGDVLSAVPRLRHSLHSSVIANAQSDVVLDCDVVGNEPSSLLTIKWFKNGEVVVRSEYFRVEKSGQRLRILGLVSSDSGVYQCIVSNEAGVIQSAARLTVLPIGLLVILLISLQMLLLLLLLMTG